MVEETRYLPITLLDNPEDLEVARMVTLRAIAQDAKAVPNGHFTLFFGLRPPT